MRRRQVFRDAMWIGSVSNARLRRSRPAAAPRPRRRARVPRALRACAPACAVLLWPAQAGAGSAPPDSASLQQCVTSVVQLERSATFAGEMTALPGSARMAMRVEVQERRSAEFAFHTVLAPGLGAWRGSDP